MGLFHKGGVIADVIRCDEPDYLIWKWHPTGSVSQASKRENEIRWGSSLRVKDGSVAVFVYKQKDGTMQDYIEGPFDDNISTANLPILSSLVGLGFDGHSPFQAEVYFINLAKIIQSKIVIPYFDVFDPRFQDFSVPVAVRGTLTYQIKDYKEFIKLHRLDSFDRESFEKQIKDAVAKCVKTVVANVPSKENISVLQMESRMEQINEFIQPAIHDRLDSFGVLVSGVDIGAIDVDKSSVGYSQLKAITQDVIRDRMVAQKEAEVKNILETQRINMEHYEESLRIQREEGAYAQHKNTQTANLGAFSVEKQAEVGVAGAEALGQMGANGAGSVTSGEGGTGFNPTAMMTGIALGGVVANNLAGTMKMALGGMDAVTPPPIPEPLYNLVMEGKSVGPFNIDMLKKMAQEGKITVDSLVWKPGMAAWTAISAVSELDDIKNAIPPIPPIPSGS